MLIRMLELCTRLTKPTNCRPNLLQCTGSYHLCAEISPVEWDHRSTCGSHHLCADQKPEFFDVSNILPAKVVTMDHIIFVQKSPSVTWGHGSTRGSHHLFADHHQNSSSVPPEQEIGSCTFLPVCCWIVKSRSKPCCKRGKTS